MKKFLPIPLLALGALYAINTSAQEHPMPGMYPEYIDFKDMKPAFIKGSVILPEENGKQIATPNTVFCNTQTDNLGMIHYRYQQSYLGIPVEYAVYIMHIKDNKVISENGKWIKDFPSTLSAIPSLSAQAALESAMQFVGAKSYKWQIPAEEAFIKKEQNNSNATFYPKANLVFYSGEDEVIPSALRLAYKFDIYANFPISRQMVFVDAITGKILGKKKLIHNADVVGSAVTAYSGTQPITADNTGTNSYRLRETGRGGGIKTLNMKTAGASYSAAVDFTDADNIWNNVNTNKDQYATDAHWGAEKTYDYYYTKYNRNSVDNAGLPLLNYVHVSLIAQGYPDNINAFWDGSRMSYGDGGTSGGVTFKPLTALDITGHEISHGVTEFSSNLNYSNESGALNEGYSDIFGTAIEFYAKPATANWLIGEDIGTAIRSMSNPNLYDQPDTYLGTDWYSGTQDDGGVHTNSGVLNYWFYLLSQGGSGTNDKGTSFNVTGIGIDKAAAIAYRTNTVYLTSTANYASARTYSIKSAEDLYGVGSAEALQTSCAFAAVGVGTCGTTTATCAAPTALTTTNISGTGATLSWTAASGATSYTVDYKTTAATTWINATTSTTATTFSLSGLTASTVYSWRVNTNCSGSASTATTASFTTTGTTTTGCTAAFEPNETQATAASIVSGVSNSAAISTSTDIDYYKFVTTATGNNTFKLVSPTGKDYDFYVYNSAGTQIGSATSSTSTEIVSLTAQPAGTYFVKVYGYNGANSTACYTFTATAATATTTGCQSTYDQVANDVTSSAALVPFNTSINGTISPSGDNDYYKFVVTNGGTATITLSTLPADYDLSVVNSSGTQLAASQNGSTTSETITRTYTAGTYYARVVGYNNANSAGSCYTLKIQLGTASIAGQSMLNADAALTLEVYPNPANDLLNVRVPNSVEDNSVLSIVDVNGIVVMQQKVNAGTSQINISKLMRGFYLIKINDGKSLQSSKFVKQ